MGMGMMGAMGLPGMSSAMGNAGNVGNVGDMGNMGGMGGMCGMSGMGNMAMMPNMAAMMGMGAVQGQMQALAGAHQNREQACAKAMAVIKAGAAAPPTEQEDATGAAGVGTSVPKTNPTHHAYWPANTNPSLALRTGVGKAQFACSSGTSFMDTASSSAMNSGKSILTRTRTSSSTATSEEASSKGMWSTLLCS